MAYAYPTTNTLRGLMMARGNYGGPSEHPTNDDLVGHLLSRESVRTARVAEAFRRVDRACFLSKELAKRACERPTHLPCANGV